MHYILLLMAIRYNSSHVMTVFVSRIITKRELFQTFKTLELSLQI